MAIGQKLTPDFSSLAQEMFTNPNVANLITKSKQIIPKLIG